MTMGCSKCSGGRHLACPRLVVEPTVDVGTTRVHCCCGPNFTLEDTINDEMRKVLDLAITI